MSDQPKTDFSTVFKFATPPTQQQAELFEGMNALMSAWMKRRHEALVIQGSLLCALETVPNRRMPHGRPPFCHGN